MSLKFGRTKIAFLPSLSAGLLVAATGVGAGDLVISALSGARYGLALLWAIVIGAVLKYALNEGLARWDVATGTTLLSGWVERLPRVFSLYFGAYLVLWGCLVAATLISYTGLVANTVFPLPVADWLGTVIWGGVQSLLTVLLVWRGGYRGVERLMKVFVALMFAVMIVVALLVLPESVAARPASGSRPLLFVLALIGGVGGTLTIMCYSYWLREEKSGASRRVVTYDLGVAYFLTALFGIAVTVIAAGVGPEDVSGYALVESIAARMRAALGAFGYWSFLIGFWAAVLTSMIGVWSGVPYLFADFLGQYRRRYGENHGDAKELSGSTPYRVFLLYLALPPIFLTVYEEPAWIGIAYALSGAFFMPFLAATLLYLNNQRRWLGEHTNGWVANLLLAASLAIFLVLFVVELLE